MPVLLEGDNSDHSTRILSCELSRFVPIFQAHKVHLRTSSDQFNMALRSGNYGHYRLGFACPFLSLLFDRIPGSDDVTVTPEKLAEALERDHPSPAVMLGLAPGDDQWWRAGIGGIHIREVVAIDTSYLVQTPIRGWEEALEQVNRSISGGAKIVLAPWLLAYLKDLSDIAEVAAPLSIEEF